VGLRVSHPGAVDQGQIQLSVNHVGVQRAVWLGIEVACQHGKHLPPAAAAAAAAAALLCALVLLLVLVAFVPCLLLLLLGFMLGQLCSQLLCCLQQHSRLPQLHLARRRLKDDVGVAHQQQAILLRCYNLPGTAAAAAAACRRTLGCCSSKAPGLTPVCRLLLLTATAGAA
jgi:hypothetical protein